MALENGGTVASQHGGGPSSICGEAGVAKGQDAGAEGGGDEEAARGLTVIQQVLPHYGDKTGAARPLAVVPDALRVGGSART